MKADSRQLVNAVSLFRFFFHLCKNDLVITVCVLLCKRFKDKLHYER